MIVEDASSSILLLNKNLLRNFIDLKFKIFNHCPHSYNNWSMIVEPFFTFFYIVFLFNISHSLAISQISCFHLFAQIK